MLNRSPFALSLTLRQEYKDLLLYNLFNEAGWAKQKRARKFGLHLLGKGVLNAPLFF